MGAGCFQELKLSRQSSPYVKRRMQLLSEAVQTHDPPGTVDSWLSVYT